MSRNRRMEHPTERIKALLVVYEELEGKYMQAIELIATLDPAKFQALPYHTTPRCIIEEMMYQRVKGKDNEANRKRVRLHRIRRAGGAIVRWTDKTVGEVIDEVGEQLSGSIDDQSIPIADAIPIPADNATVTIAAPLGHIKDAINDIPVDLSRFTDEELIEMGLKEAKP